MQIAFLNGGDDPRQSGKLGKVLERMFGLVDSV